VTWWWWQSRGSDGEWGWVVGGDVAVAGCVGVGELAPGVAQERALARGVNGEGGGGVCW